MLVPLEKPTRDVHFAGHPDSPNGAKKRKIIREMDRMRRELQQAVKVVLKATDLCKQLDAINTLGSTDVDYRKVKDAMEELIAGTSPVYGGSLEKELDDEAFFEV